jgi:hypothetical protein
VLKGQGETSPQRERGARAEWQMALSSLPHSGLRDVLQLWGTVHRKKLSGAPRFFFASADLLFAIVPSKTHP